MSICSTSTRSVKWANAHPEDETDSAGTNWTETYIKIMDEHLKEAASAEGMGWSTRTGRCSPSKRMKMGCSRSPYLVREDTSYSWRGVPDSTMLSGRPTVSMLVQERL